MDVFITARALFSYTPAPHTPAHIQHTHTLYQNQQRISPYKPSLSRLEQLQRYICLVSGPDTCKQKPDIFRCIRSSRGRHFLRCSLFKQQSLFRRKFLFKLIHCCVHGRKQERILTKKYYHKELLTLKRSKLYIVQVSCRQGFINDIDVLKTNLLTKKFFTRPFAVFPFVTELAYHAQFATVPPSNYHLFVMCKSTVSWPDFGYFRDFATQLGQKR